MTCLIRKLEIFNPNRDGNECSQANCSVTNSFSSASTKRSGTPLTDKYGSWKWARKVLSRFHVAVLRVVAFYRENSRGIWSDGGCLEFPFHGIDARTQGLALASGSVPRSNRQRKSNLLLGLSRTLVSIRLAAGCSIFDANAKPSEKVNANAKLDTRRTRRLQKFEEQQIRTR